MHDDPIARFKDALSRAEKSGIELPNAAAFATSGKDARPTVRMLLLKEADREGFVFYMNMNSPKARQLRDNARASACFWWPALQEQVRVEGSVEAVSNDEADSYFATRPRGSQIGAWASDQSSELASRDELIHAVEAVTARYGEGPVPRPPHWSGYRLVPECIEFWVGKPDRLHERELYTRDGEDWRIVLLAP
ncbi:MAG: pyridoxamine 5'-phosphate oxidase [Candidatus Krumholzibacteriia bacterium]